MEKDSGSQVSLPGRQSGAIHGKTPEAQRRKRSMVQMYTLLVDQYATFGTQNLSMMLEIAGDLKALDDNEVNRKNVECATLALRRGFGSTEDGRAGPTQLSATVEESGSGKTTRRYSLAESPGDCSFDHPIKDISSDMAIGDDVKSGNILLTAKNPTSSEVVTLRSPVDGRLCFLVPGGGSMVAGKVVARVTKDASLLDAMGVARWVNPEARLDGAPRTLQLRQRRGSIVREIFAALDESPSPSAQERLSVGIFAGDQLPEGPDKHQVDPILDVAKQLRDLRSCLIGAGTTVRLDEHIQTLTIAADKLSSRHDADSEYKALAQRTKVEILRARAKVEAQGTPKTTKAGRRVKVRVRIRFRKQGDQMGDGTLRDIDSAKSGEGAAPPNPGQELIEARLRGSSSQLLDVHWAA